MRTRTRTSTRMRTATMTRRREETGTTVAASALLFFVCSQRPCKSVCVLQISRACCSVP
jgi:hypothetical protein